MTAVRSRTYRLSLLFDRITEVPDSPTVKLSIMEKIEPPNYALILRIRELSAVCWRSIIGEARETIDYDVDGFYNWYQRNPIEHT
jgi:hypothetical protein